jgi:hypothetical protein
LSVAPAGGPTARQVEELAVPTDIGYHAPGERGQRRIKGLQRGERGRLGASDDAAARALSEKDR